MKYRLGVILKEQAVTRTQHELLGLTLGSGTQQGCSFSSYQQGKSEGWSGRLQDIMPLSGVI